eukprot:10256065-Alexandrium_andersonii.AAC.1
MEVVVVAVAMATAMVEAIHGGGDGSQECCGGFDGEANCDHHLGCGGDGDGSGESSGGNTRMVL